MAASPAADFLVELGTEELPPKALKDLMNAFAGGLADGLTEGRLKYKKVTAHASPRRLAVVVSDLARAQEARDRHQKGPPVSIAVDKQGNPTKAGVSFANKCGVDFAELTRVATEKGEWLSFSAVEEGQPAAALLPGIVLHALNSLPIPRRMRWGSGDTEFVRPVHWLIMLHGKDCVAGSVLGIGAGRTSRGHRFMAPGDIEIDEPDQYLAVLAEKGFVIADFDARREKIVRGVEGEAKKAGGTVLGGAALYDEVTALTEWPVAMSGTFDESFLGLPREVIIATLTGHQRYFPVVAGDGGLLPVFITVANIESKDPARVRRGNERVIQPRLADAAFFWQADQQVPLGERVAALNEVVYQKGLGSIYDKSVRFGALASLMAGQLEIDGATVARAAVLAKADLLTGMVGEFPELQGVMGRYYATSAGETTAVAAAIGEQYLPRFAGDELPSSEAGQLLAVADRLDTLAGIFALGKKPSGNRDPFGLRRAALGIIRILIENSLDVDFIETLKLAIEQQPVNGTDREALQEALYDFVVDRLRRYYLDQNIGITTGMFEAVRAKRPSSLRDFDDRLKAVAEFSRLESSASLAAANKRTANILRQAQYDDSGSLDPSLLSDAAEVALYESLRRAEESTRPLLEQRAYAEALTKLAELRPSVDRFFDEVLVMSDDVAIRQNRLALLAELRASFLNIADVSRLTAGPE